MLQDVEVGYKTPVQGVSFGSRGVVRLSSVGLKKGYRNLGEADALSVATMLPGINNAGDYSSGISVNGSDYSHNIYTLDGAPVFFPYRFGGIFSDFNPYHVGAVEISSYPEIAAPINIGADIDAYSSPYSYNSFGGAVNIGLVASSASLHLPMGRRTSLKASARVSHLNYLYDKLLSDDSNRVRYSFADVNLTLSHEFSDVSTLTLSGMLSDDRLSFADDDYLLATDLKWGNKVLSANYETGNSWLRYRQLLSYSALDSRLGLSLPQFSMSLPASVSQVALAGEARLPKWYFDVGYRVEYNDFSPQYYDDAGHRGSSGGASRYGSWLFLFDTATKQPLADAHSLRVYSRSSYYLSGDYSYLGVDRGIGYEYEGAQRTFSVLVGTATQFMHQVGFSDIGLASNFFLPALQSLPPLQSLGVDFSYVRSFKGNALSLSANAYAKLVYNASEFSANVLDVLNDNYDPLSHVITGDGFNIGGDITLRYDLGCLSGWTGYSLGIFRRKYPKVSQCWYPSATEPMHSFKIMADYKVNAHFNLSAFFIVSSGRRYTPIESVYIVGGNVIPEYGAHNSAHLPLYHRLDLSATYMLPVVTVASKRICSYLNISLLNAYMHDNIEMQYYDYDVQNNTIQLRKIHSVYRFLPSVSYSIEF